METGGYPTIDPGEWLYKVPFDFYCVSVQKDINTQICKDRETFFSNLAQLGQCEPVGYKGGHLLWTSLTDDP